MGADCQLGWYYFDGQLRYKDGHGWTERYKPIEGPGTMARATKNNTSDDAGAIPSPVTGPTRRRISYLVTAVCAGMLGLGLGLGGGNLSPDVVHGGVSWASEQVGQVSALFYPKAPSTPTPLTDPTAKVKTNVTNAQPVAADPSGTRRDVNAFAMGGPAPATVPASYDHPRPSDCLKFRDQLRAWSEFQNAHRPTGFTNHLPSNGDVQYLQAACGLSY